MKRVRVGISGWRYAPWRGVFYPKGLAHDAELAFAAARMSSIEINGSFYSLQRPELYRRWRDQTPPEFLFSVKGSRFITHMKRLIDVEVPLANFFASGLLALEHKLGPILWQFPERMTFDERFEQFFRTLPRDTRAAARLAARHDERLAGRALVHTDRTRPLRHAIEVRSTTFCVPEFIELCRRYDVGLVVADTAGRWPMFDDVTADFVYVRLHGDSELYKSGYGPAAIARWAERVRAWRKRGDVYVYFDNDMKVHAPFDAMALMRVLGVRPSVSRALPSARSGARARPGVRAARTRSRGRSVPLRRTSSGRRASS